MILIPPPMTNAERQRKFQAANPGYDRRRKARQRAIVQQSLDRTVASLQPATESAEPQARPAPAAIPATRPLLMLPAPVRDPAIETINALAASLAARAGREPVLAAAAPSGRGAFPSSGAA